jgi:sialate O-acetylesterase
MKFKYPIISSFVLLVALVQNSYTQNKIRIACIGNSITYGYLISHREINAYPAQLQKKLGNSYEVLNFGASGKTALHAGGNAYINTSQYREALASKANIVFIKLGTNDSRPYYRKYIDSFYNDYKALVHTFKALDTHPRVVLLYPVIKFLDKKPDEAYSPDILKLIAPVIDRVAAEEKCEVVDLHAVLANHPEMFPDKLHPDSAGAALIADRLYQFLSAGKKPEVANTPIILPKLFSSNMVLQQGRANPIWGKAGASEHIVISFAGKTIKIKAGADGNWKTKLPAMDYGGPYTMQVKGSQIIEYTNVMIGEVWVCSGQSNMGLPLDGTDNSDQEIASANYPLIRIFNVPNKLAQHPQADMDGGRWVTCTPASIKRFSAVAYYFGKELHKKLNVAIGLIHSSVGGTFIENWISSDYLLQDSDFAAPVQKLLAIDQHKDTLDRIAEIKRLTGEYLLKDEGLVNGKTLYADPDLDISKWVDLQAPAPWTPLFGGIGWCRKEFNLTADEAKKGIEIHLSRIDDDDNTYLNGQEIGATQNVGDRQYKAEPTLLKEGRNILVCRIRNRGGIGGMIGKAEEMFVQTAMQKISLAGVWKFKLSEVSPSVLSYQKNDYPTILYNGMITPLMPYGIKGVLWYQGEANTGRAKQYHRIFPALINDWRAHWGQGDFPFVFVSLANFQKAPVAPSESSWAELREAQASALSVPNTGMSVSIDLDDDGNLHPTNKQDVGKRAALSALKVAYHQDLVYSSPIYKSMKIKGQQVRITFDKVGSGLQIKGQDSLIKGFAIAGADKKFYWAKGKLQDDHTVIVWADEVSNPVTVRYAWADNPGYVNLYNKEGLPVNSFRVENWDKQTKP